MSFLYGQVTEAAGWLLGDHALSLTGPIIEVNQGQCGLLCHAFYLRYREIADLGIALRVPNA